MSRRFLIYKMSSGCVAVVRKTSGIVASAMILWAMCIVSPSCTQNRGYIGDWFGFWWLDEILVDGRIDTSYQDDAVFSFMSDVVCITRQTPDAETMTFQYYGSWEYKDGILYLNYNNKMDHGVYPPPAWIYMTEMMVYEMKVLVFNSKHLELEWVDDDGRHITYRLHKVLL